MAILTERPGIQVSVRIDRWDAEEYECPEAQAQQPLPNSTTKYIEAVSDAEFSIVIRFLPDPAQDLHSLGLCIYVDGTRVQGSVIDLKEHRNAREFRYVCDGALVCEEGKWLQRALRFSELVIDKKGRSSLCQAHLERIQCLGDITVRFYRVNEVGKIENREEPEAGFIRFRTVSEKMLKSKGVSHQVCTGDVKRRFQRCGRVVTEQIDPTDEPWAEFTFRYRARDALEAEEVIPKSVVPTFDSIFGA